MTPEEEKREKYNPDDIFKNKEKEILKQKSIDGERYKQLRDKYNISKSDMDIIKENYWLIILSALLILFGVFCAILPHIAPHVSYDSLQTKEVTVTVFKHFYGGPKGASYDYIRTTDGEKYNISGDYQRGQLQELLTEQVQLKWARMRIS